MNKPTVQQMIEGGWSGFSTIDHLDAVSAHDLREEWLDTGIGPDDLVSVRREQARVILSLIDRLEKDLSNDEMSALENAAVVLRREAQLQSDLWRLTA